MPLRSAGTPTKPLGPPEMPLQPSFALPYKRPKAHVAIATVIIKFCNAHLVLNQRTSGTELKN